MIKFGLINLRYRRLTFALYSIVSILSIPSRILKEDSSLNFLLLTILLGCITTAFALPMLWTVCYLNQKFLLGERWIGFPLIMVALAGAARGAVLHVVIRTSGLEDNLPTGAAMISSAIFTSVYFVTISTFVEVVLQRRERFNHIFENAQTLLASRSQEIIKTNSEETYEATLSHLRSEISKHGLEREDLRPERLLEVSRQIQLLINEVLRPLSHRLWVNAMGQIRHKNFLAILKDSITELDFDPKYFLLYQYFIGGYGISLVIGLWNSFVVSTLATGISALLISAYFGMRRRQVIDRFLLGVIFLVLEGFLPTFIPILALDPTNLTATFISALIITPSLPIFIVVVSTYRLIRLDRDIAIEAAQTVENRIRNELRESRQDSDDIHLAQFLHNSLQSELFGITKRLEFVSHGVDDERKREVIDSLDQALTRSYDQVKVTEIDGKTRIEKLSESWRGIADITVSGIDVLRTQKNLSLRASQIFEELITNSIRYGEASRIDIVFAKSIRGVRIQLTHNGRDYVRKKTGLGSLLLERFADTEIQAKNSKNGVEIVVELEIGRT